MTLSEVAERNTNENGAAGAAGLNDRFVLEAPFTASEGHAWLAPIPDLLLSSGTKHRATFRLFEDDTQVAANGNAMHADITASGGGRHLFWPNFICFSATDNSDPNTSGHRYSLRRVTDTPLGIWPLGGCTVYNPAYQIETEGHGSVSSRHIGFNISPYTHTTGEHAQLLDYVRGAIDIPAELRSFCNIDFAPKPGGFEAALRDLNVVLVEQCSDVEMVFRGTVLNRLRLADELVSPAAAAMQANPSDKRWWIAARGWYYDGLIKNSPKREEFAAQILELMPHRGEQDELLRAILRETTPRQISSEDFLAGIARIREMLGAKLGVITHTQRYMPDGRPISWPPNLHDDLIDTFRANGIPVLHPCELVEQHTSIVALKEDLIHWHEDFMPVVGQALREFAREIVASDR